MPSLQFVKLAPEKQAQIMMASLSEFAQRGYDLASTNRIVTEAEISKGVLFKYFDDKESLFVYVCETAVMDALHAIQAYPVKPDDDLFSALLNMTMEKIRFSRERPLTYQLLMRIAKEPDHPVYAKVMKLAMNVSQRFADNLAHTFSQSPLREGVTWEHVMHAVTWISEGLREKYMASIPDTVEANFEVSYEPLIHELKTYFEMLKHGVYTVPECQQEAKPEAKPGGKGHD